MPFYIRTNPRRPWWHLAAAGAGVTFFWATAQAVLLATKPHGSGFSGFRVALVALLLTVAGGAVAGGGYWLLGWVRLAPSKGLRLGAATLIALAFLVILTLAASQGEPSGLWSRVARSSFLVSSLLLAVVLGWLIVKDPFGLVPGTQRVYLTPSEFGALPAAAQAALRLESSPGDNQSSSRPAG